MKTLQNIDLVSVKLIAVNLADRASIAYWMASQNEYAAEFHETEMLRHYAQLKAYFEPDPNQSPSPM